MKPKKGGNPKPMELHSVEIEDPSECTSEEDLAHWVADLLINHWLNKERKGDQDD